MGSGDYQAARLADLARYAAYHGQTRFSRFLDPAQRTAALAAARDAGARACFWGGYAEAERVVCGFTAGEEPATEDYPIACLEARWNARYASPGHRDFLGAQMALGQDRACFGDIAPGEEDRAFLFVSRDSVGYLLANFTQVGRAAVRLKEIAPADARLRRQSGISRRITVASVRLDAVAAEAFDASREKSRSWVLREQVKVNHAPVLKPDAPLRAGDLVSVRGQGRFRLCGEPAATRKGRLALEIEIFSPGKW